MYHKRLLTQSHKKDHLCGVKKLMLLTGLFTVPLKKTRREFRLERGASRL